jgi:pimeloyl-ACP methyl ester carboxylesterase
MLSEPQVIELINQIVTPTKLIYADKGYIEKYPQIKSRTGAFQGLQLVKLNGGHHVHMQQPQQVADEIASWLAVHHSH